MLSFALRIAIILLVIYLVRGALRDFLRRLLSPPSPPNPGTGEIRGVMMKDPVCGTYVDVAAAVTGNRGGKNYFFCSEECRQKFASAR